MFNKTFKNVIVSYAIRFLRLNSCLKYGPKLKIARLWNNKTKTELSLLSLDASKIVAKKIALRLIGELTILGWVPILIKYS
jgi:hypothetical protein